MFRKIVSVSTVGKFVKQTSFQPKPHQFARFSTNATETPKTATETPAAAETEAAKPEEPVDPLAAKDKQIAELTKSNKDLKDQVLRSYAEEENVRRIARNDVEAARTYANTSFAKSLLDVADNLERALAAVPADVMSSSSADPTLKSLVEGIEMTEKQLQKVFQKFGVVKYGAPGDVFDPSLHDALYNMPASEGKVPGTIGQVMKTGYKLKDRVIRAAEIGAITA